MQKSFDKSSLENQNLGSLSNTVSPNQQGKRWFFIAKILLRAFAMLLNVNISDDLSRVMAVCGNGNVHAWLTAGESTAPLFGLLKSQTVRSISNAIFKFYPNPRRSIPIRTGLLRRRPRTDRVFSRYWRSFMHRPPFGYLSITRRRRCRLSVVYCFAFRRPKSMGCLQRNDSRTNPLNPWKTPAFMPPVLDGMGQTSP